MRLYDLQERAWIERDGVNATEMLKRCPERYSEKEITEPQNNDGQTGEVPQELEAQDFSEPRRKERKKRKASPAMREALERGRATAAANRAAKKRMNERDLSAE